MKEKLKAIDLLERAWGIIANASDWHRGPTQLEGVEASLAQQAWVTAAAKWRDEALPFIAEIKKEAIEEEVEEIENPPLTDPIDRIPSLLDYYETYGGPARRDWSNLKPEERSAWVSKYDEHLLWLKS